jgi:protein TonB
MFDEALVESHRTHTLGAKRLSLPVAIGLHAAVLGTFVGASVWFTGEAPEPAIPVVFPTASSAGPPPPPEGGGETKLRVEAKIPAIPPLIRPSNIPDAPIFVAEDAVEGEESGASDAEPGPGSRDGVDGGTGTTNAGPAGAGDTQEILPVGGDVRAPVLIQSLEPVYPEAARKAGLEGTVILEAIIAAFGEVQEIRVLKSVHPLLDEAAERAVRQWRYRPATLNGRAVPVYLTVTVTFRLNR